MKRLIAIGGILYLLGSLECRAQQCQPYWKGLSGTLNYGAVGIVVYDSGTGPALYGAAPGTFPGWVNPVKRWNGSAWVTVGTGLAGIGVQDGFRMLDDGQGPRLYYLGIGAGQVPFMKRWPGPAWHPTPKGMFINAYPFFKPEFSFNQGTAAGLYGVEYEQVVPGTEARKWVLKWSGGAWKRIGDVNTSDGIGGPYPMFAFDFGQGPELIVTGTFLGIAGIRAPGMARWNGERWRAVTPTPEGTPLFVPYAMCAWDDGIHGTSLYVGFDGSYSHFGVLRQGIARWTGSGWESVGGGFSIAPGNPGSVRSLSVFDDGTGPALFAAGTFNRAGGIPALQIAKWNGQQWSALGAGVSGFIRHMAVVDDGRGESLFITGVDYAGGGIVYDIAQYVGCKTGNCYPDCDFSRNVNANDFVCFITKFAAKDPYANCDLSTAAPAINAADFQCFMNKFAAGCP